MSVWNTSGFTGGFREQEQLPFSFHSHCTAQLQHYSKTLPNRQLVEGWPSYWVMPVSPFLTPTRTAHHRHFHHHHAYAAFVENDHTRTRTHARAYTCTHKST